MRRFEMSDVSTRAWMAHWAMEERPDGDYILYSEAMAEIESLRAKLAEAESKKPEIMCLRCKFVWANGDIVIGCAEGHLLKCGTLEKGFKYWQPKGGE